MALIVLSLMCPVALAGDFYLIIIDDYSSESMAELEGYQGRYWGRTADKIYLSGGDEQACWLAERGNNLRLIEIEEPSELYLYYGNPENFSAHSDNILDSGDGYVLTESFIGDIGSYRRLTLKSLPVNSYERELDLTLTYHPIIEEMINEVEEDTIIAYLRGLSGEDSVTIGGEAYSIDTRYSGTPDNEKAAQWLKEIMERYGYQGEYHAFYGGSPRHVAAYDENLAWLVTENSEALKTTDGGTTWETMPDNASGSLWGIANSGADSVWITGDNGVIRFSSNGGASFSAQTAGTGYFLFGVFFFNSTHGWIAVDNGRVLRTEDGGQNWSVQTTSTGSRLYDVCFADENNGWAVGRSGVVIHTTDGGLNWSTQSSGTNERLYGVDFIDASNGWLVGWGGVVRRTTDGGSNWTTVNVGSNVEKYHVDFANESFGCIVGWNGEIFTTVNGGDNWELQSSGTLSDFYGVDFVDDQTGFAVGGGIIEKTTDGGITWVNQTVGVETAWLNVIATKTGSVSPDEQVIICGHFDNTSEQPETRAQGADDNGSGTIAVVEAARIFADVDFRKTIKFCFWTGEEQGLLGSAAYAGDAYSRADNIIGVFNFDMIAWDGNSDYVGELHCGTMSSSQELGAIFEDVVSDYSINLVTELLTWASTDRSDHASFWDYNYPAMLGIEDFTGDFNPYYHTTNDNINNIMPEYFLEYTKAAVGTAATLASPTVTGISAEESSDIPFTVQLIGNYPNPFNASTTIKYQLPVSSNIRLDIYNLLGQKVETLIDDRLEAGYHSIQWNASAYSSGIYFYKLTAGDKVFTKRMTLLK